MQDSGIRIRQKGNLFLVKIIIKHALWVVLILLSFGTYTAKAQSVINSNSKPVSSTSKKLKRETKAVNYLRKEIKKQFQENNVVRVIELCGYLEQRKAFSNEFNFYLGKSYLEVREFLLAKTYLKQVQINDPHYTEAVFYLAGIEKMFGRLEKAKDLLTNLKGTVDSTNADLVYKIQTHLDALPYVKSLANQPATAVIYRETQINHPYSDLAPFLLDSTHFVYTHVVEDSASSEEQGKRTFSNTRLSEAFLVSGEWADEKDLKGFRGDFNRFLNGSFCAEDNSLYLTRVAEGYKDRKIEIYTSELKGRRFGKARKLPEPINLKGTENQHPFVSFLSFRKVKTKVLFFTSNRPGGYGGKDIWYATWNETEKIWNKPLNAGNYINTAANEITPSFDSSLQVLYFSSNQTNSLGGYDVYQVKWEETGFYPSKNLGVPINSGFDEHYFYRIPGTREGYFCSNRPDGKENRTCCDDIFQFTIVNPRGEVFLSSKRTKERGYEPVFTLYYETNSEELNPSQKRQLDSLSFSLIVNSHKTVLVKGHTDDVGGKAYNLTLSEKRAGTVYDYLAKRGVEHRRMLKAAVEMREPAIPYDQLNGDALSNARKFNRRVEIYLISQ